METLTYRVHCCTCFVVAEINHGVLLTYQGDCINTILITRAVGRNWYRRHMAWCTRPHVYTEIYGNLYQYWCWDSLAIWVLHLLEFSVRRLICAILKSVLDVPQTASPSNKGLLSGISQHNLVVSKIGSLIGDWLVVYHWMIWVGLKWALYCV